MELVLSVLQVLLPRVLVSPETLCGTSGPGSRQVSGNCCFGELLDDQPVLRAALGKITSIEEAEAVMYTFGQYVADKVKEGEARGVVQRLEAVPPRVHSAGCGL